MFPVKYFPCSWGGCSLTQGTAVQVVAGMHGRLLVVYCPNNYSSQETLPSPVHTTSSFRDVTILDQPAMAGHHG